MEIKRPQTNAVYEQLKDANIRVENGVIIHDESGVEKVLKAFLDEQQLTKDQFEKAQTFAGNAGAAYALRASEVVAKVMEKDKGLKEVTGAVTFGKSTSEFSFTRSKSYTNSLVKDEDGNPTKSIKKGVLTLSTTTKTEYSTKGVHELTQAAGWWDKVSD